MSSPARFERRPVPSVDGLDDVGLGDIEARMLAAFSPPLDAAEVRHLVASAAAAFEHARVRTFLAVLIERAAIDLLRGAEQHRDLGGTPARRNDDFRRSHLHLVDKEAS